MFETALLIILYDKEIFESETVNSLLVARNKYLNTKIVIWNNGPRPLEEIDISRITNLGYKVEIQETLENFSLAKIYNKFIDSNAANRYIILDDDSLLNTEYINESAKCGSAQVGMPIIRSNQAIINPNVNNKPGKEGMVLLPSDRIITIGSGLVIGKEIAESLKAIYSTIFDERFFFYGVDTTFCFRIHHCKFGAKVKIIPGFKHSLSRLNNLNDDRSHFRVKERSYDAGLTAKYYLTHLQKLRVILTVLTKVMKSKLLKQAPVFFISDFFKALITGSHYRA